MSTTLVNVDQSILVVYGEARRRVDDVTGKWDARRKDVGGYLVEDWREQVEEKKAESLEPFRKDLAGLVGDLRELRKTRVPFLAGTDVGVAFMYPGFTLHDELDLLVHRLGFSPMETLRTATQNPARFFGLENCQSTGDSRNCASGRKACSISSPRNCLLGSPFKPTRRVRSAGC